MSAYYLTAEAKGDLDEIADYLFVQGGTGLVRYVQGAIEKALVFLSEHPNAGHYREDLTDEPVKFWPVFSYLIVYDPATTPIGIARVLHSAQDLPALLQT